MSPCWLALARRIGDGRRRGGRAVTPDGQQLGTPSAWRRRAKPLREALRVDERPIDPDGAPASVSLALPPAGVRLPFDDLAVRQARRLGLARPPPDGVSTLLRDDSHFEGAINITRSPIPKYWLLDDPSTRIFPRGLLPVGAGGPLFDRP